jgi:hypothetical protein
MLLARLPIERFGRGGVDRRSAALPERARAHLDRADHVHGDLVPRAAVVPQCRERLELAVPVDEP